MSEYTTISQWYDIKEEKFETTQSLRWELGRKGSGMWLEVPAKYPFDVTVPSMFLRLFVNPRDARYLKASCLHDYALHEKGWDRVTSAAAFSEALKADKVGKTRRLLMVLAVITCNWK